MNKMLNKIILISILFLNLTIVCAEEAITSCKYNDLGLEIKFDEAGTGSVSQTRYEQNQTPGIFSWFFTKSTGHVDIINELEQIDKELYGSCPESIYACTLERKEYVNLGQEVIWDEDSARIYSDQKKVYLFNSENNMKEHSDLKDLPNKELVKSSAFKDNFKVGYDGCGEGPWGVICGIGTEIGLTFYDGAVGSVEIRYKAYKSCDFVKYTGDLPTYNLACPNLNVYIDRFNAAIDAYESCKETDAGCLSHTMTKVEEEETMAKDYCKAILAHHDYDGGTEQDCMEACIHLGENLIKAKKSAGLLSENSGDCGFSDRLLVWISNIFRWIKYILPVAVIVLGILDFIKAIGSDKDDEMKKAQGRFIKRLIAAALAFLIPLIIEFVLDKMGFGYNDCSLF